ncbi:MAG: methyl-accepting chemotaxis protein, partial [Christensenellaceae bacterium]|nr:methyl-accepting chemotaxis protein [Christensenellaceae bacterium]
MSGTKAKRRLNLGTKLTASVAVALVVVLAASFLTIILTVRQNAESDANQRLESLLSTEARRMEAELNGPLTAVRALAGALGRREDVDPAVRRDAFIASMRGVLEVNPSLKSIWICFEPNAFDGRDAEYQGHKQSDATGRFIPHWYRDGDAVTFEALDDYSLGNGESDYYETPKRTGTEMLQEPYWDQYGDETLLITSLAVPIKGAGGKVVGVVGGDLALTSLQQLAFNQGGYASAYYYGISNRGLFFTHADAAAIGTHIKDRWAERIPEILDAVGRGLPYSHDSLSVKTGGMVRRMYTPISVGNTATPWSLALAVELDEVMAAATQITWMLAGTLALVLAVSIAVTAVLVARMVSGPLRLVTEKAQQFAAGDFSAPVSDVFMGRGDEVGDLAQAFDGLFRNMNSLLQSLKGAANQVGAGARQISDSSTALAQGATEQASSVEERSASMEQIAAQTQVNTENAKKANELSEQAKRDAEQGNEQMKRLLGAMDDINHSSGNISGI